MKKTGMEPLRISGKTLGTLAVADSCELCFWLVLRLKNKLPYSMFAGIFSSIDSYSKRLVHAYFDVHGAPPNWLSELGPLIGYRPPPHYSRFNFLVKEHNILLTGMPDGIFVLSDGSIVIVDYKTARFTPKQDELLPMYVVQLNAYALIARHCGFDRVGGLALVYTEPVTEACDYCVHCRTDGFDLGFVSRVLPVELNVGLVERLLARTREIWDRRKPPAPAPGCKNCALLDELLHALSRRRLSA
jgi:hypothetical protein